MLCDTFLEGQTFFVNIYTIQYLTKVFGTEDVREIKI